MGTGNRSSDQWSAAICGMDVRALRSFVVLLFLVAVVCLLSSFVLLLLRRHVHCGAAISKTLVWLPVVPDCFSIVIIVVANQQFVSSDSSSLMVLIFLFSFSNGFSLARFNLECLLSSSSVCTCHCVLRSPEFCGWVSWCHFSPFSKFFEG